MRLYYIRHGQSANNALWARTGSSQGRSHDPELTETGRAQAACLARFLAAPATTPPNGNHSDTQDRHGVGITHIYTSLMIRAVATSSIIADALDLPVHGWPDWHECGGLYLTDEETGQQVPQPGPGRSFFEKRFPRLVLPETLGEEGWYHGRPFEDRSLRPLRAQRVLQDLLARHGQSDDRVAVVSHGGFHHYIVAAILGLPAPSFDLMLNNAAITRFDFTADGPCLLYLNYAAHLPDELIT